MDDVILIVY